jgi:hypothetical protein
MSKTLTGAFFGASESAASPKGNKITTQGSALSLSQQKVSTFPEGER